MPNDLTAKRNLLNWHPESRSESQRQTTSEPLENKGFFPRGGGVFIWTISGITLAACSSVEDFLGLDDGGGGGGRSVHVQSSPVQGARLYFDADDDGTVSMEERAAQDAQHPQGFITDATGEAHGIPANLHGKAFVAVLDGAFDADTGAEFPANTKYQSIPNAAGDHLLASPITDYVANQLAENLMPEEVDPAIRAEVAELLGLDPADTTNADQIRMAVNALLDDVSDHNRYDGSSGIDALARYFVTEAEAQSTPTPAEVEAEVAKFLGDNRDAALTVTPPTAVTIGANDEFVATIEAESLVHAVRYSIDDPSGAFTVNERGVILVTDSTRLSPGTMTLNVMVTNSDGDSEMVSVEITVADSAATPALTAPDVPAPATIAENTMGGDLITGITNTNTGASVTSWVIRAPGGLSDKFAVEDDSGNHKLVLKSTETLDHEAFTNGEINVDVWGEITAGVRSNTLTFTITVEDANDAPVFLEPTTLPNGETDVTTGTETVAENARQGHVVARVDAHDHDTNPD